MSFMNWLQVSSVCWKNVIGNFVYYVIEYTPCSLVVPVCGCKLRPAHYLQLIYKFVTVEDFTSTIYLLVCGSSFRKLTDRYTLYEMWNIVGCCTVEVLLFGVVSVSSHIWGLIEKYRGPVLVKILFFQGWEVNSLWSSFVKHALDCSTVPASAESSSVTALLYSLFHSIMPFTFQFSVPFFHFM
jgi:hypothetical protein